MLKHLLILKALWLSVSILPAQDTLSFHLTPKNNISIQGTINGQDTLNFMFHTAASEVSLIEEAAKHIYDLKSSKSVTSHSWGGEGQAKYILNNELSIGAFTWDSLTFWVDRLSGQGTEGKFGPNLFKDHIIELDYENQEMILHDSSPEILATEAFNKFTLTTDRGSMYLEGELRIGENHYVNKFMIHSGYSGTILLDNQFAGENRIGEQVDVFSESQLKDSYGNVLKTRKAILPAFEIAGHTFTELPFSFFEGTIGNQRKCVLGSEILKRFTIFLDQQNNWIYFKPNELMKRPVKDV